MAVSAMANSFVKSLYCSRLCLISRTAANVEIAITAADNSATRRSSDAMPFVLAVPRLWDQTATTRVSNPNGISAGASSQPARLIAITDRFRDLSFPFPCRNPGEVIFHFLSGSKRPHFNERGAPARDFADLFNRTSLKV